MTKEIKDRKQFLACIPHRLEVEDRPELSDFPLNVLFANCFKAGGVDFSANALYEPEIESYREDEDKRSLDYRNVYNPENLLTITKEEEKWVGVKTINEKIALLAEGQTWKQFFTQLTIVGLSNGERCRYERLDSLVKDN